MSSHPTSHDGQQLKEFREMLGIKQEVFANALGDDWDQKKVSRLEEKEKIDNDLMDQVAKALQVKPAVIRNFNRERAIYNIQNNHEGSHNHGANVGSQSIINPVEKWIEALEENKKLYERIIDLLQKMAENK